MIRPRSWTIGNVSTFAVSLSFEVDPEQGRGACFEQAATWGSFAIWVNGLNLCRHRETNHTLDSVNWYLLPMLRWMVDNWDYLLHEERLPNKNQDRDAWLSIRHAVTPPPALDEEASDNWEESRQRWWWRHSLLACRDGGLFPNVIIRRFRNSVEFSWGPTPVAGRPHHYQFHAAHGYARIEVGLVADQLEVILDAATGHLISEVPGNETFQALRQDFEAIRDQQRTTRRLGMLAGISIDAMPAQESYKTLSRYFDGESSSNPLLEGEYERSFVREAPQACLMFGSISPTVSSEDIVRLGQLVSTSHDSGGESSTLSRMTREVPIQSALDNPWEQGYELAEAFHEALKGLRIASTYVDIEKVIEHLEIVVKEVTLDDRAIRAVAIAGEQLQPTIAINSCYKYQEKHPRRFTFAHELCHLLHDRAHGVRLALVSGPWAPVDIEKRANAFAAMFLMPSELIETVVRQRNLDVDSIPGVWQLCESMQVSFSAAVEHLCNLGYIDEITRDAMKQQVIDSHAPFVNEQ